MANPKLEYSYAVPGTVENGMPPFIILAMASFVTDSC
jgi:hypothetical protein